MFDAIPKIIAKLSWIKEQFEASIERKQAGCLSALRLFSTVPVNKCRNVIRIANQA